VPPLLLEQRRLLNREKNPQFRHCRYQAWILRDSSGVTGRILAYIDQNYNELQDVNTGFFGFFECINDQEAARLLFQTAAGWLRREGMEKICGPLNFSIGNECGILIDGFEHQPVVQMSHNPPYYASLFEASDFVKEHDLYAYRMTTDMVRSQASLLTRLGAVAEKALQRKGVKFRVINMKAYRQELRHIHDLYNDFMRDNWGFSPTSFEEMLFSGESLRMIADPEIIFFAEVDNVIVGCSVAVPDINQVLKRMRGRLFPFGIFKLLWYRKKISRLRLILLGVRTTYRNKGLDVLFYYYTITRVLERGYTWSELSWISEKNRNLVRIVEKIGADRYKTYRVYQKRI
jgi:hypothetical protein